MEAHWSAYICDLPGVETQMPYWCIYDDCNRHNFSPGKVGTTTLAPMIMHLNDHHKLSREEIADWLDKLHDEGVIDMEFKERDNG